MRGRRILVGVIVNSSRTADLDQPVEMRFEANGREQCTGPFCIGAVVAIAILLRFLAIFNDAWFDEIWSFYYAFDVSSAWEIFLGKSYDNNNPLNTFFIRMIGDRPQWQMYRLLSLTMGTASLPLFWSLGGLLGRLESVFLLALGGLSYPLVLYSSEARGLGPAVFFSLASFLLIAKCFPTAKWGLAILYWSCIILGYFSYPTFVFVHLGLLGWSIARLSTDFHRNRRSIILWLLWQGPAIMFFIIIFFHARSVQVGGGDPYVLSDVLIDSLAYFFGIPKWRPLVLITGIVMACVVIREVWKMSKRLPKIWVFYALGFSISPALIIFFDLDTLYPRYFLVLLPFLLAPVAQWLAGMTKTGRTVATIAATIISCLVIVNILRITILLREGRGHYVEAMKYMVNHTPEDTVTVASDHDFRNGMVVLYYKRFFPNKRINYIRRNDVGEFILPPSAYVIPEVAMKETGIPSTATKPPEWYITHSQASDIPPPPILEGSTNVQFRLEKIYPTAPLSGMQWNLYRHTRQ